MSEQLRKTISTAASAALLRIAGYFHEEGQLHQALTPYLKLLAYYPESKEATLAAERLVTIAEIFEERGQFRMAMSVYDRMEQAARFRRWDGHVFTPEKRAPEKERKHSVEERRSVPFPPPIGNGDEVDVSTEADN